MLEHKDKMPGEMKPRRNNLKPREQEPQVQEILTYAGRIIATLGEPFVVLDKSLRVQMANQAFYQAFNAQKEETEGRGLDQLANGQWNFPRLRTLLEDVASTNQPLQDCEVEHEFPVIGKKVMRISAHCQSVSNESDLILLAIEDITEHRRAEEALKVSEIRYRRLFEAAKDGILILDAQTGKITDANPFMSDLLGYSHREFSGKELWEIGLFSDKSDSQAAMRKLQDKGYLRYDHLPLETTDGRQADIEMVANVYLEDDAPVIQCNIRDITERRRLEKMLSEQSEALADLHRRKDEFLAMLSHELRNPLAPILNAVQLLGLQKHEDRLQRQARLVIERQVAQLTHLVDDLMDVSRIVSGRIRLRCERLVMNGIVELAIESARPLIEQCSHGLIVSMPPKPIWLHADAARLEQIVVNLLSNASKYTKEGGQIRVILEQEGDECVLRVRDTGVGIDPSLLPHIFDLFTQSERSLDRSQGGLGIGLALVQRLTEMHGGKVEAHSTLGQGSEFVVRLPLMKEDAPQPSLPAESQFIEPMTPALRVLVVDDNVDAAEILATMLKYVGHDVRVAHTGSAGFQAARDFEPQVVLLDIGLPGLDGYEVAKRIRQETALKDIILVAVTGYGQEADLQASLHAGFNYHLVKPVSFTNVKGILATAAEKAK